MKMEIMGTTIEEILKLDYQNEDKFYTPFSELEMFYALEMISDNTETRVTWDKLTEREYVNDLNNDERARQLTVILYEGVPFAIYQYTGRGDYTNNKIFNIETYKKFVKDYMDEYLDGVAKDRSVAGVTDDYHVHNYNGGYFEIVNNKIESRKGKDF